MKHNVLLATIVTTYMCFLNAATAATPPVFTPEQEARIGQIATDYLVAHPEVLVTVSQKLQAQQRERQQQVFALNVMNHLQEIVADPDTPVVGPASASVAVIEFFDYQCVHCSRLAPTLEKVMSGVASENGKNRTLSVRRCWNPAIQRRNGHAEVLGNVLGWHTAGQQLLG